MFSSQAELRGADKNWTTQVLDLSLKGALLTKPQDFQPGQHQEFVLNFNLSGLDKPIRMQGKVCRVGEQHLGFQCELLDIDSVTELRRLIELNLSDDTLLHRDLEALIESRHADHH